MKIPTFEELLIRKNLPAESSWGVFGDNDALGCLNFLTPEGVVEAARRRHIGIEEVPAVRAEGMNIPPLAIHTLSIRQCESEMGIRQENRNHWGAHASPIYRERRI